MPHSGHFRAANGPPRNAALGRRPSPTRRATTARSSTVVRTTVIRTTSHVVRTTRVSTRPAAMNAGTAADSTRGDRPPQAGHDQVRHNQTGSRRDRQANPRTSSHPPARRVPGSVTRVPGSVTRVPRWSRGGPSQFRLERAIREDERVTDRDERAIRPDERAIRREGRATRGEGHATRGRVGMVINGNEAEVSEARPDAGCLRALVDAVN